MNSNNANENSIKEFKFTELKSDRSSKKEDSSGFVPLKLSSKISDEQIRTNRNDESESGFAISQMVREHRGLVAQERLDFEKEVEKKVLEKLEIIKKQAYDDGFSAGNNSGHEKAYEQTLSLLEEKVDEFSSILSSLQAQAHSTLEQNKAQTYKIIKNLTKWILLKEIDNQDYIERLLEKLIYEINTKSNLIVRVNETAFNYMPEIIKRIESRIGELENIRVKVDPINSSTGIILESENGIVDGSFESQLEALDKIFESVGDHESNS